MIELRPRIRSYFSLDSTTTMPLETPTEPQYDPHFYQPITPVIPAQYNLYRVLSSDTLTTIATKYNTTVEELVADNGTPIRFGQLIKVRVNP